MAFAGHAARARHPLPDGFPNGASGRAARTLGSHPVAPRYSRWRTPIPGPLPSMGETRDEQPQRPGTLCRAPFELFHRSGNLRARRPALRPRSTPQITPLHGVTPLAYIPSANATCARADTSERARCRVAPSRAHTKHVEHVDMLGRRIQSQLQYSKPMYK